MKKKLRIVTIGAALFFAAAVIITGCNPAVQTVQDTTPPAEVTELKADNAVNGKVSLSWKNPGDADLYQVEISAEPAEGTLKKPVYLAAEKDANSSFVVEGLSNGTSYTFTVKTIDKSLNKSKGVKTEKPVTPQDTSDKTAPAEVTELKADNAVNGKVSLSWKNPADDDLYQVEINAEPAAGSLKNPVYLAAAKEAAGSYIVTDLANGTGYTFTVRTIDKSLNKSAGVKTEKPVIPQDTSDKTAPAEVTELKADNAVNGKVSLSWKNPADDDLYQIKISAKPAAGSLSNPVYLAADKGKSGSFMAEGLTNGTAYTFTIQTIDKTLNESAGTTTKDSVTPVNENDSTSPAEVSELTAVAGDGKISLSWKNPADYDLYQVEITASPADGSLKNPVYLAAAKEAAGSYTATDLTNGTGYTFTVKTIDKSLNKSAGIKTEKPATPVDTSDKTPPAEVSDLTAVAGDGKISLSWTNPADDDLHQVEINAEPAAGSLKNPVYLAAAKGAAGSYTATGLANGKGYTFTIKTIDKSLNKSAGTTTKEAIKPQDTSDKTAPKEVTDLEAIAGNGKVSLSWTNPTDDDLHQVEITASPADGALKNPVYLAAAKGDPGSYIVEGLEREKEYTVTVKTIDKSGNKSPTGVSKTVTTLAANVMNITLTQNPTNETWTNGNVTVEVSSDTSIKKAKWIKGAKSASEVLESGTDITDKKFGVTENGMYSVAVLDKEGRREVKTVEIKNIDRTKPQKPMNFIPEYKLSVNKIILRWVDPADTGSGVKELHLTYTVNGENPTTETIAAEKQIFEIPNVAVKNPPERYDFTLKAVDNAGNVGGEVTAKTTPTELAEVTGLTVSRKKIDKNDPDRKVTVTIAGYNLTKAAEITITGSGTVVCTNVTDSGASADFDLPGSKQDYSFTVSVKQAGDDSASPVPNIEAKAQVCEPAEIAKMTVTKQDGSAFATDNFEDFKVKSNTGGEMKIVLEGTNLDIDGAKAGVNFNGHDYDGTANESGTKLTIEQIPVPMVSSVYPIQAQLKPRYKTEYTILPSPPYSGYQSKRLRVLGDVVLKEL